MLKKCNYCQTIIDESDNQEIITKLENQEEIIKIHEHYCSTECLVLCILFQKKEELTEQLADCEHKQWSQWMKYLFNCISSCKDNPLDKTEVLMSFKKNDIDNWRKAIYYSNYNELFEDEKEIFRLWSRNILEVFKKQVKK